MQQREAGFATPGPSLNNISASALSGPAPGGSRSVWGNREGGQTPYGAEWPEEEDGDDPESDFDDWGVMFKGEEKTGAPLAEKFAAKVNACLRIRPDDEAVKGLSRNILLPSNVPNLKFPEVNKDVALQMDKSHGYMEKMLSRVNGLLGKVMAPVMCVIDDVNRKKVALSKGSADGLRNSLKLATAAFNSVNYIRKVNVQNTVRDRDWKQVCHWESKIGDTEIFPFDMTKRVKELRAAKTSGRVYKNYKEFQKSRGRGRGGRGGKVPQPFLKQGTRGRGRKF